MKKHPNKNNLVINHNIKVRNNNGLIIYIMDSYNNINGLWRSILQKNIFLDISPTIMHFERSHLQ